MNLEKKKVKSTTAKPAPPKKPAMPMKKNTEPAMHDHDMMDMNKVEGKKEKEMDMKGMDMSGQNHEAKQDSPKSEMPFAGKVNLATGKTVRYDLYVTDTMVNYTGKRKHAFAINGTIPGPDLVFTEGDTAAIYVHNLAKDQTSIHWHGVILPNQFDGVPYLTTQPVHTGETHLYKFAVQQNGTYWYHSHSGLQEQAGVYGALIFKKKAGMDAMAMHEGHSMMDMKDMKMSAQMQGGEDHAMHNQMMKKDSVATDPHAGHNMADMKMPARSSGGEGMDMKGMQGMNHGGNHMQMSAMPKKGDGSYNKEQTIVLSEWTDEKPSQVQRRLRTVNDWYAIKKGSTQSYSESGSILLLYVFRLLAGIFSAAFFIASSAYIADNTSEDKRGGGMSLLVSVAGLGAVAGPLIGNLFSKADITIGQITLDKFSLPFSISAILVLLVCGFLFFSLKESYNNRHHEIIDTKKKERKSVFIILKSIKKSFVLLLFLSFISQLSLAMFEGTFALHSQRLFQFGVKQMSLVFIVCGSVMGLLQLGPVAWLIKWKGERALLPYGLLILGIGMSLLMLSSEIGFILFFVSIVSAGMAILTPCLASLVTKESDKNYGTALGIFSSVNSLGQVLGVVIGSVMMISFVHLPYFIISILLLLTACIAVPKFRLNILHLKNIGN